MQHDTSTADSDEQNRTSKSANRSGPWPLLSLNFFMADMQAGIGPFLGVYLLAHGWQSGLIGIVMTIGGIAGMLMTIPAGALIDQTYYKRTFVIIPGICTVIASAIILFSQEYSGDIEALSDCFASNATVRDEGHTYEGLAAIKEWKAETKKKYNHTIAPLEVTHQDEKTVLKAKLTGNFPGSPVTLEFSFVLESGKIVYLEIH